MIGFMSIRGDVSTMEGMSEHELEEKYNELMLTAAIVERNRKAHQKYYEVIVFQVMALIVAILVYNYTNEYIIPKESQEGRLAYFGVVMISLNVIYFTLNKRKMFYPQIDELIINSIRK